MHGILVLAPPRERQKKRSFFLVSAFLAGSAFWYVILSSIGWSRVGWIFGVLLGLAIVIATAESIAEDMGIYFTWSRLLAR